MAFSVPKIGVTATTATVVIGQLVTSMIVDHFGLFANEVTSFTLKRFIGIVLMVGAPYFVYKSSNEHEKSL